MNITTPRLPSGFNEYLPQDQIEFNRLLSIVQATYEKYGFSPLDTSTIELSEVLLAKGGGETEQQIYRFERGKNDLSLRFDLTVPLARYVAQYEGELSFPFRRYQVGKVFRAERAQAGRFREFYQCDIDVVGSTSPIVDAEFPVVIYEIFQKFNVGKFTIRMSNRKVLNGYIESIGLGDLSREVMRTIDKIEKISVEKFEEELASIGCDSNQIRSIKEFTTIKGSADVVLRSLDALSVESAIYRSGVDELKRLVDTLRATEIPEDYFTIDLTIARGLDYYTGTVYETVLDEYPGLGSVCSGGRYDNLASNYTKSVLPGVGVSIGLTRLFYQLKEAGIIIPRQVTPAKVMVVPLSDEYFAVGIKTAAEIRKYAPVYLNTEDMPVKKKMKFADKLGMRFVVLIGEDEISRKTITVKDMDTGENTSMKLADFGDILRKKD